MLSTSHQTKSDCFYRTLISSASLDEFPKNTTSNFSNIFAVPLVFPKGERWKVALHSITFNNDQIKTKKQTCFVRVCSNTVDPSNNPSRIISEHARESYNIFENRVHHYDSPVKEYFNLISDQLTDFHIRLSDRFGNDLVLTLGQPTIVVLQFKRIEPLQESFVVRVANNTVKNVQQHGFSSTFHADLPDFLSKGEKQWEVCLKSITFQKYFKQFKYLEGPQIIHFRYKVGEQVRQMSREFIPPPRMNDPIALSFELRKIFLTFYGDYDVVEEQDDFGLRNLYDETKSEAKDKNVWKVEANEILTKNSSQTPHWVTDPLWQIQDKNMVGKSFGVVENDDSSVGSNVKQPTQPVDFTSNNRLPRAPSRYREPIIEYGIDENLIVIIHSKYSGYLHLPLELAQIMGVLEGYNTDQPEKLVMEIPKNKYIYIPRELDQNRMCPQVMMLYASFIKPSPVGSVQAPILKSIPVTLENYNKLLGDNIDKSMYMYI